MVVEEEEEKKIGQSHFGRGKKGRRKKLAGRRGNS